MFTIFQFPRLPKREQASIEFLNNFQALISKIHLLSEFRGFARRKQKFLLSTQTRLEFEIRLEPIICNL